MKSIKKIISFIFIVSISLALTNCKHDDEVVGPELKDFAGEFELVEPFTVSKSSVDFSKGETISFNAKFSKIVNWEIHVTDSISGALKIISGQSKEITAFNSQWDGNTTQIPLFDTSTVSASLMIKNEPAFSDEPNENRIAKFNILAGKKYNEGLTVTDFENGSNPNWKKFIQSGANMFFTTKADQNSAQGDILFQMQGAVSWDYLIALINFPDSSIEGGYQLSANPSFEYFNFFVRRPEELTNGFLLIRFQEDDDGDGMHNIGKEDSYERELRDFKAGWQQISFPYSSLQIEGTDVGGNNKLEPNKLVNIEILFLADPQTGYSELAIDNLIFTRGGKFIP